MNKILAGFAAFFTAGMLSAAAHAAPVDFVSYASNNEHGVASGTSVQVNGIDMTLYTNPGYFAYFDDVDARSRKPAGLGVCRNLNSNNHCNPGSDDSIDGDFGTDEFIKIVFDNGPFDVRGLSFNDGKHNSLNNDSVGEVMWMTLDAAGNTILSGVTNFQNLIAMAAAGVFAGVNGIGFQYVGYGVLRRSHF